RRDAIGDPPMYQGTAHAAKMHYPKDVSGPDAYETTEDGEIKAHARNALSHWHGLRFPVHDDRSRAYCPVFMGDFSTFACT
ncbi:hypothetical protein, partial [Aminobacter sp. DSM 101952]|uniref:hypothetical protein n=1 Tax=Aminobacter sp. DSM 101952 TaxID=2735891 RepID=UPI001AEBB512